MTNRKQCEMPVKQPLTFGGIPRSEGGTIPDVATTIVYSDAIRIGDSETQSAVFQVSNVSGTTHALIEYQTSWNFDSRIETGNEASPIADWVDETEVEDDLTADDTESPYALSPLLAPYIRFKFSGAASNGSFNRIRGVLFRQ